MHGYGEHAGRYRELAERWQRRGISSLAVDLRGHGRSAGPRGHVDRFADYHRDLDALLTETRQRAASGPVALLGHSMGGLLTLHWLLSGHGNDLAGVVLSSPYLGLALELNPITKALGSLASGLLPRLGFETGLSGAEVCRDPEIARQYDADPLNNSKASARWFTEANAAMASVHQHDEPIELPILLLYGGDDRVASADATDRFARRLDGRQQSAERLDGCFHEILNEPPAQRQAIADRIADWLLALRSDHGD